jgi:catechol 2,3-dioxygenase-like lactoylglutathione lyase family enzyme
MIPAEFNGIDHVVLRVADMKRALDFYVGVLGLPLERVLETIGLHQVRCGRNLIDLIELKPGQTLAPDPARGMEHLCLSIRGDIDEIVESLRKSKVQLDGEPMEVYGAGGFGTSVYVRDPDGHLIELKFHYARNPVRHGSRPLAAGNA